MPICIRIHFLFKYLFIYLFESVRLSGREGGKFSIKTGSLAKWLQWQGFARPEAGARHFIQVFYVAGNDPDTRTMFLCFCGATRVPALQMVTLPAMPQRWVPRFFLIAYR